MVAVMTMGMIGGWRLINYVVDMEKLVKEIQKSTLRFESLFSKKSL